jgi:hypothetical protein
MQQQQGGRLSSSSSSSSNLPASSRQVHHCKIQPSSQPAWIVLAAGSDLLQHWALLLTMLGLTVTSRTAAQQQQNRSSSSRTLHSRPRGSASSRSHSSRASRRSSRLQQVAQQGRRSAPLPLRLNSLQQQHLLLRLALRVTTQP